MRNYKGIFIKGHPCYNTGRTWFKKGHKPAKPFKKGQPPVPHKKGCLCFRCTKIPWNKGKPYPQIAGKNNWNWKGGKRISNGYLWIYMPNHPRAVGKYVKNAILVLEKKIKRHLTPEEIAHHINGIKDDDRPENLQLCKNRSEHTRIHSISQLPKR